MIQTAYILGASLFSVGLGLYVYYSVQLSRDLQTGAIPVRKEP